MFGLFGNNKQVQCPVKEDMRLWLENAVLWSVQSFGQDKIKNLKVLTPHFTDFPIKYNGQQQTAIATLKIVATQMEINFDEIHLDIYAQGQTEIDTGGFMGNRMFLKNEEGEKYAGGLYFGKQEDGKYHIGLKQEALNDPIEMIATLSHELSHIKLLGEKRIEKNNEHLTDLTTVIFGLGIFNANSAFQRKAGYDGWSWSKLGYFTQMEWGYSLALFAYYRGEQSPKWIDFLSRSIKADFKQGTRFINNNKDKIFKPKSKTTENEGGNQ
jgi:hypothetical protein